MRYIVLREKGHKKRVFIVLVISVNKEVEVETRSSGDLMKLDYIGTAEISLDIKIADTTWARSVEKEW